MDALASLTFLDELLTHDRVIDVTIFGGNGDYTVHLVLVDKNTVFGRGTSLASAISEAHIQFESLNNSDLH
jgi:hypothetical protein